MDNIEINTIKYIQNFPSDNNIFTTCIMEIISAPFNLMLFLTISLILNTYNKISDKQLLVLLSSQIIVGIIKQIIKRERPFIANNEIKLYDSSIIDQYSFPSGHTLNAFLLSFMLKNNLGTGLGPIPYLVGLSRIYLGVHYPSDIFGGFILAKIMLDSPNWLPKD